MNHRELIALLGGTAAFGRLVRVAQQPDQMRRIGVLMGYAESDLEAQRKLACAANRNASRYF